MDINEFTDEDLVEENSVEEIVLPPEEPSEISLGEEIQDEIVVEDFPVEEIPIEEVPIEPEGPESSLDPKVQVYVPKATTYRPGIASYDGKDFLVDPKGKVSLIVDLNKIKENSDTALEKSSEALGKAEEALETANDIDGKATEALTNSESALETANDAKSIAEDALEQVIIGEGTKIYENGVLQASINVDRDIQEQFNDIDELIPPQASSENQLADKEFVNSSIASNTANFIGTFVNVPALLAYTGTITNNDYAFVVNSERDFTSTTEMNAYDKTLLTNFDYAWIPNGSNYDLYRFDIMEQTWVLKVTNTAKSDVTLNIAYNRYKAVIVGNIVSWVFEYTLNNSSFTADQWAAINSGITASRVAQIADISNKADKVNEMQAITAGAMRLAYVSGYSTAYLQFDQNAYALTLMSNHNHHLRLTGGDFDVENGGISAYGNIHSSHGLITSEEGVVTSGTLDGGIIGENLKELILDLTYPVGSYFFSNSSNFDTKAKVEAYFGGTWTKLGDGYFVEAGSSITTHSAGLPNITGWSNNAMSDQSRNAYGGAFSVWQGARGHPGGNYYWSSFNFDASRCSSIYGNSSTVQPKSRTAYVYYRTA